MVNVGKYTSPMDPMGMILEESPFFLRCWFRTVQQNMSESGLEGAGSLILNDNSSGVLFGVLGPTIRNKITESSKVPPPKFNMEPENDGFPSSESPFPRTVCLQVKHVKLQGWYLPILTQLGDETSHGPWYCVPTSSHLSIDTPRLRYVFAAPISCESQSPTWRMGSQDL